MACAAVGFVLIAGLASTWRSSRRVAHLMTAPGRSLRQSPNGYPLPQRENALGVAAENGLLDSNGRLDGKQAKTVTLKNSIKTSVQLIGIYHDECAGGEGAPRPHLRVRRCGAHEEQQRPAARVRRGGERGGQPPRDGLPEAAQVPERRDR